VYRFLLSRRWLGLLLVAVVVASACVLLGRWQLHRLESRRAANHQVSRNIEALPVAPGRLLGVNHGPASAAEYSRVRARGDYDQARQLLVRSRPLNGAVGFQVLVPLRTDAGPALLVDRGWVPSAGNSGEAPDVPPAPSGPVTVTAWLRASELPSGIGGAPPPGQVTRIDVSEIRKQLPYPVYGGYGVLTRERPAPRKAPELLPLPELSEGPHLAYAVQWFLFAALALGGYVVLARREAADRRAASGPAATVRVPIPG
jgi:cytochrome oxidase assembly protein ShyY1